MALASLHAPNHLPILCSSWHRSSASTNCPQPRFRQLLLRSVNEQGRCHCCHLQRQESSARKAAIGAGTVLASPPCSEDAVCAAAGALLCFRWGGEGENEVEVLGVDCLSRSVSFADVSNLVPSRDEEAENGRPETSQGGEKQEGDGHGARGTVTWPRCKRRLRAQLCRQFPASCSTATRSTTRSSASRATQRPGATAWWPAAAS